MVGCGAGVRGGWHLRHQLQSVVAEAGQGQQLAWPASQLGGPAKGAVCINGKMLPLPPPPGQRTHIHTKEPPAPPPPPTHVPLPSFVRRGHPLVITIRYVMVADSMGGSLPGSNGGLDTNILSRITSITAGMSELVHKVWLVGVGVGGEVWWGWGWGWGRARGRGWGWEWGWEVRRLMWPRGAFRLGRWCTRWVGGGGGDGVFGGGGWVG